MLAPDPAQLSGMLKRVGGSASDDFNNVLANRAIQSLWIKHSDAAERQRQMQATLGAMLGVSPRDEIEGMIAAQMIACHNAAMECYRRAMIGEQTFEGRRDNLAQAGKLSRTLATLIEVLNRHRGKGEQRMRIEHVHVHAGGQAIVGEVTTNGRGGIVEKIEERAHAKTIAHAPEPPMPSPDPQREAVPVAGGSRQA